ncbi:MAG: carboxypeptidase M32 [Promethearchaeota archaeon]|nr:MAG: carboxypeptidase M32 [Candidatus Lokiarchaeota archaeon]
MPLTKLKEHFAEINKLRNIRALLNWDQQIYMPNDSNRIRSEQIALIQGTIHDKLISNKTRRLLELSYKAKNLTLIEQAFIREAKREYEIAIKVPNRLIRRMAKAASLGQQAWEKSKIKNDFNIFKPYLERIIEIKREYAKKLDSGSTLYDALLDLYEPRISSEWLTRIFNKLKTEILDVFKKIKSSKEQPDPSILRKTYDPKKQLKFIVEMLHKLDFNFNIGRLDKSMHPFTSNISSMDTRITTNFKENFLPTGIFGALHEYGHAIFDMNFMDPIKDSILADGCSFGFHESQSQLWENIIGHSKQFWDYWYPILQNYFPEHLAHYPGDEFYRSINSVQPSFIRVDADEITFNLHILLRFELEKAIINDNLPISDLPELWNLKMEELIGIVPPNDSKGILQDVHWSEGIFGYFPSYILGNLYSAQIYYNLLKNHSQIHRDIKSGQYNNLISYLKQNIYQYGKIYRPDDLIKKITGESLNPEYFTKYLRQKYFQIYIIQK